MSLFNLFNKPEKENQPAYQVGQEWHYHTRSGEENSTLKIVKTEQDEGGVIVHIYVSGIHLVSPGSSVGFVDYISHLPLAEEALIGSITRLKNDRCEMPDYEFGYVRWKTAYEENKAGVFSLPLKEILQYLESGKYK